MSTQTQKTILLVEDETIQAMSTGARLKRFGYAVIDAQSGEKSVSFAVGAEHFDLVLMDIDLGNGIDGIKAARQILLHRTVPIIFLTSHIEKETVVNAREVTCYGYVIKDSGDFVLQSSIEMAFALFDAHKHTQESEERYRALVEWSPDAIAVHRDGKILFVNQAAVKLYGAATADELLDTSILDRIHIDFHQIVLARVKTALEGSKDTPPIEIPHVKLDGTIVDVEVQASHIIYDGAPAIRASLHSVAERNRANERIFHMSQAVEQSPASIVITDRDGSIEYVNRKFTDITGYTLDDVVGKNPRFLQSGNMTPDGYKDLWETITAGGEWHGEFQNRKKKTAISSGNLQRSHPCSMSGARQHTILL